LLLAAALACTVSAAPLVQDGRSAAIDSVVRDGIARGAYPGAALVIGRRDTVLVSRGYGRLTWNERGAPVSAESTLYDLASVTKVVATTTALMLLVERGQVSLDAAAARYVPEFAGEGTGAITVRQLLNHTAGLRGTLPLYRDAPDRDSALRIVYAATPIFTPGSRVLYSDLNAILLGEIVARVAREPLETFVAREILEPFGLRQTLYRPPRALHRRIAPTGIWRGTPVAGQVHDANAAKLGGVAGHAGLFGTAVDLARFARILLAGGVTPEGRRVLRQETVRQFTAVSVPARRRQSARALGWQALPTDEQESSAGRLLGPRTYGHTGFTGTSIWIDPDRDVFIVLLTNREYAPRSRTPFTVLKEVRGRVADAAARWVDGP
jgi:CubicO group peptidase (beta-lactamase class C family)